MLFWRVGGAVARHPWQGGRRVWPEIGLAGESEVQRVFKSGKSEVHVTTAVVVVLDRRVPIGTSDIDCGGVLIDIDHDLLVIVIVFHRRCLLIGDAGELETVLDLVPRRHRPMRLQSDHDGHSQADAEKAEQSRQENPRSSAVILFRRRGQWRSRSGSGGGAEATRFSFCDPLTCAVQDWE